MQLYDILLYSLFSTFEHLGFSKYFERRKKVVMLMYRSFLKHSFMIWTMISIVLLQKSNFIQRRIHAFMHIETRYTLFNKYHNNCDTMNTYTIHVLSRSYVIRYYFSIKLERSDLSFVNHFPFIKPRHNHPARIYE